MLIQVILQINFYYILRNCCAIDVINVVKLIVGLLGICNILLDFENLVDHNENLVLNINSIDW